MLIKYFYLKAEKLKLYVKIKFSNEFSEAGAKNFSMNDFQKKVIFVFFSSKLK